MAEEKKGKKEKKKRDKKNKSNYYEASGETFKRNRKHCPKCGAGIFLAQHKERLHCGKCGYTEIQKTVQEKKPEAAEQEQKKEKAEEKSEKTN